jgi:hypothetical protein
MECSICGYKIMGEPVAKYLIRENGDGQIIVAMRTCRKPLCQAMASYVYSAVKAERG